MYGLEPGFRAGAYGKNLLKRHGPKALTPSNSLASYYPKSVLSKYESSSQTLRIQIQFPFACSKAVPNN